MNIQRIGVVGAGTMGNGIAQVFAQAGFDVRLVDAAPHRRSSARAATIEKSLAKFVEKGKLTAAERDAALARLSTGTDVDALADADYVVEAIFEDARGEARRCSRGSIRSRGRDVILVSNTSSISITAARRRDDAAGQGARACTS